VIEAASSNSNGRPQTVLVTAHAWYEDLFGGAFRVATELARGLAASGRHVTFLCCNVADAPGFEMLDGVEVRRYHLPARSRFVPRVWQHIRATQDLARQIAAEYEITAVSGHSPLQYMGVLRALGRGKTSRCTYVVHSPFAEEQLALAGADHPSLRLRSHALVGAAIDGWCLRRSQAVHCLSQFTAELLERRYGASTRAACVICPGWVDTERFQPVPDRQLVRCKLPAQWHTHEPILLSVRRLESRMGLETLIEAASVMAGRLPFRVLIGGSGPESARLQEAINSRRLEDRVILLGRISEEQLPLCYAAADAFVLPTRALECFGLIVLEAFAAGTPVIGSRVGAIPELLGQVGDNWIFEPGDVAGLASRLTEFLEGRLRPTVNLREVALRYDVRHLLPRWIDLCLGTTAMPLVRPSLRAADLKCI
jgi:glycosyltransferase involved in cell wall biosynthesis